MKLARWLLPALSLLLVLMFTWWDLSRSNAGPGPVHPVHAAVARLDGGANCAGCHRDGAVDAQACMDCHAPIVQQRDEHKGLHGTLAANELQRCESCHSDHHGDAAPLVALHAFARAGVDDRNAYDHRHVTFELAGAHAALACARCHQDADAASPPAGGRFLGLSQACASCHQDVHAGALGAACQECHGQEQAWAQVPLFRHQRFVLDGAHQRVACASCHQDGTGRDVGSERQAELRVRSCSECHADPHGTVEVVATALRLPDTADCARCHQSVSWSQRAEPRAVHEQRGFPLRGSHATAACASCHGEAQHIGRWSDAAPALAACAACHDARHSEGLLGAASRAGPVGGCAGCHQDTDHDFAEGRVTAEQHRAIGFELAPPHAEVACAECHRGAEVVERYPGRLAEDCRTCHVDVHDGQFPDLGSPGGKQPRQCTECHAASHFAPHAFGPAAHSMTTFPLRGAHDAVACNDCHGQVVDGVRRFRGTAQQCAQCHQDVHAGRFDRAGRPAQVDGRRGCARCHDSTAFAPVATDFDHGIWTGYELAGAHAKVGCAACHSQPSQQGQLGSVPGQSCSSCHVDPHLGQFAVAGATDCRRCHESTVWSTQHFDHNSDSRFQLDAVHGKLACGKCHISYPVGDTQVVRYKPLGVLCGDCHQLGRSGEVRPGSARR